MRSGDGDRPAAVHQQRQDVAAMHDADAPLVRRDDFGVVGLDGAGVHHGVGATHVVGLLADFDGDAEGSQPFGLRAFLTVGTVDVDATLMEHFGEHAHTGATDAVFPYAINAMRETIGGMYGSDYMKNLAELMIFAVVGLLIGLVIRIPFVKLNHFVEKRMEDTKMM